MVVRADASSPDSTHSLVFLGGTGKRKLYLKNDSLRKRDDRNQLQLEERYSDTNLPIPSLYEVWARKLVRDVSDKQQQKIPPQSACGRTVSGISINPRLINSWVYISPMRRPLLTHD
jgi:hypothetical protein